MNIDVTSESNHVILDVPNHAEHSHCDVAITCVSGAVSIGPAKFNHSWTMNDHFEKLYPTLYSQVIKNNFDISGLTDHELCLIKHHGMFKSCGEDRFEGWQEYRFNVKIDGKKICPHYSQKITEIYHLIETEQCLTFALSIPQLAC
jgi:hypothetical protein